MGNINYTLLPVKAHYLFFMASMGPILPFLPVFGKQLGISEVIMGLLMSLIPILFVFAKPIFGFILDYFQSQRKTVFIALVVSTTLFFVLLHFIPNSKTVPFYQEISCEDIANCSNNNYSIAAPNCHLLVTGSRYAVRALPGNDLLYCSVESLVCPPRAIAELHCVPPGQQQGFYSSVSFWGFVVLLSAASVGYNVANSVSDTICFDVLGSGNEAKYGQQRVWGTVGFGLSALLGGYCVDLWSESDNFKDYTPAFAIAILFTTIDLLCCFKLKLPVLSKSTNILKDVTNLLKNSSTVVFLIYAAFLGICESLILFFLFWYLEDLAMITGTMEHIKLLQGLTVAAETLIGEIVFFPLSGRILKAVGYRHCLSLCFLFYTLRLGLLSLITNPWWALPIELLQGPSYALSYTTVVAYASAISPPGTSATMQGLAAGMDDGFGYSIGSLMGGLLYKSLGGSLTFRVFSGFALVCSITHWFLCVLCFRNTSSPEVDPQKGEKRNIIYNPPKEAAELVQMAS